MSEVRLLWRYLGSYKRDFVLAAVCMLFEGTLELLIPFLTAGLIDQGIVGHDLSHVWLTGAEMLGCGVTAMLFGMAFSRFSARSAMGLGANLRDAEFVAIQGFSYQNIDKFDTSSLVTRMTTDVTVIQNAVMNGFRPMMRGPVMFSAGLVLASLLNARLACIFFVMLPLLAVALVLIVRHVAPLYRLLQTVMDRLNEVVQESATAIRAVKAFVRGEWVEQRFGRVNDELSATSTRTFRGAVLNLPLFQTVMYTIDVLVMALGGRMILNGELTVGELTGFMSYVLQITNSLMMISNVFLLLTRAFASVERVSEVLDERPTIEAPAKAADVAADSSVELRHAGFKYSADAAANVLEDICLKFPAGSTVGVLGGTGSGKSSLVSLLPRLYDASEGQVLVGGRDVREYDLHALRAAVTLVPQTCVLFTGTVRENLLWGNANATDSELLEACRLACADEFLERIGGLDADLGHGGAGVSGGQRQRLCIARALVGHPKVIIFDDSTSAVDMATDARIREGLASLTDVTKFIVAQRIASVQDADAVVILDEGRVHAVGTPAELLASDPIYQELYRTQVASGEEQ